jgi:chromate transporter
MLLAGGLFILPAMLIMLAIAWTYQHFESTRALAAVLYGIRPVIVGVILWALVDFGRKAIRRVEMAIVAAAVTVLTVAGVNPILLLLVSGLALALMSGVRAVPMLAPLGGLALSVSHGVPSLFLTFLKIGATTFGSGYVLLAFLHSDVVQTSHWLTERQLFDAVAIGQATPGPLFTTATFIGYLVAGVPGAVAATVAIFLPGFLLIPFLDRIVTVVEEHPPLRAFLDGVTSAVVGLIAGVVIAAGRIAVVDVPSAVIAVVTFAVLLRHPLLSPALVVVGAMVGLVVKGGLSL